MEKGLLMRVLLCLEQSSARLTSEGNFQSLYFEYSHSTHQVIIKLPVSHLPEFPFWLAVPSFMTVTLFAVFLFKKKCLFRFLNSALPDFSVYEFAFCVNELYL